MSRPKPTIDFPTQRDAIMALTDRGHGPRAIAARLSLAPPTVRSVISKANGVGEHERPSSDRPKVDFELGEDVLRQLRPHARRRDTTVRQLAREIVEAAIDLGLVDRLLDGRF